MESYMICGCFTRKFEKAELQPPGEVKEFFNQYAECGPHMTAPQLHRFMVEVQGEATATLAEAEKVVEEIKSRRKHPHMSMFSTAARKCLTLDGFFTYLLSVDLNPPIKPQVHHDMTAPLSHYFIYTGHNSYLTGNQISSDCSDVPIIKALQKGVRVIELDLWPTPNKEDVHVLHGKTLTAPVELMKCLKSIKEYAFCASPYPVILTLEDHLNPTLQAKVAQMITQIFGDMLFYPESEISSAFPSPEELKYKVIISTKPPKEYLTAENSMKKSSESEKEQPSGEEQVSVEQKTSNDKVEQENIDDQAEDNSDDTELHERPAEYKKLITIPGIKRGELKESLKVDPNKVSRLSWSEQLLAKATTSYGPDIIRYTQKNIMRIFPKVTRFNSSNYDPFLGWMHGAQMVAFNMQVHHDMKRPLSHYFLHTGHNSYLTGNQLSSTSSIEPIIKALRSGVKVIELDLWPNRKNPNEIEVRHGGTMTTPVEFIRCLEAIKENAFCTSEYPVIITFEDHLNSLLQAKVAEMVKNTFGDILYTGTKFLEFPSPEDLKGKILISTKPPKESHDSLNEQEHHEQEIKHFTDGSEQMKGNGIEFGDYDELEIQIKDNKEEDDEDTASLEYKHLIAIHALKSKSGIKNLLKDNYGRVARLSMNEEKLKNVVKTHATDIVRFTQTNLLRVYPKGTRILSSNYNPMIAWTHGAQMVALNMQGYGKNLWIMQGMFRANGGCGYVKKPDFLLCDEAFDPSIRRSVKKTLKVKLYMGDGWRLDFRRTHFDPFSPPDFFTKVEIWGVPADIKKEMTMPVEDQWVPMWNKEFEFPLTAPELALLRLEVCEYDLDRRHGFGGQTCLPVSELRSGIRAVPLYNKKGEKYDHVKLLMRFQFLAEVLV